VAFLFNINYLIWRRGQGVPCPGLMRKQRITVRALQRTLGEVFAYFKYQSTKSINQAQGALGCRLWQRNYYEHIIRDEKELQQIREYIINNPIQWAFDDENPERVGPTVSDIA
jgi:REP element-mobilizing transposase RayT